MPSSAFDDRREEGDKMNGNLSKFLPMSLGGLFGQAPEASATIAKRMPPLTIPGAYNAPELCLLLDPWRADLAPSDAVAEVKLDGIRSLYAAGQQFTREGTPMECASHCLPILQQVERALGEPMFFDGEYLEEGGVEATLSAFRARRTGGVLWLFDAVPFTEWRSGNASRLGLVARKRRLRRAMEEVGCFVGESPVGFVEATPVRPQDVEAYTQDLWAAGYEGAVIKSAASRYVRKRTCDWMKVKACTVTSMIVVDLLGTNRNGVETAGSVVARLEGNPPTRPVRIPVHGAIAATLWKRRSYVVGQRVPVTHAGFTGGGQPREARILSL